MKFGYNFEDSLLRIFILIEENKAESTMQAIQYFKILYQKETGKTLSDINANEEMKKSYNSFNNPTK